MGEPTVSIVMTHYRRPSLLLNTLWSILHERPRTVVEVVVVDDDVQHQPDTVRQYCARFRDSLDIRLVRTNRTAPNRNQAFAMNAGARAARGRYVILQNAECFHVGPVVDGLLHVARMMHINADAGVKPYLCAPCLQLQLEHNKLIDAARLGEFENWYSKSVEMISFGTPGVNEYVGLSNERYFYFTALMRRDDYVELGGLEESFQFANYEDDFHVELCRRNGFRLEICHEVAPWMDGLKFHVLHQWHERPNDGNPDRMAETEQMHQHLMGLIKQIDRGERPARANVGREDEWGRSPNVEEIPL